MNSLEIRRLVRRAQIEARISIALALIALGLLAYAHCAIQTTWMPL